MSNRAGDRGAATWARHGDLMKAMIVIDARISGRDADHTLLHLHYLSTWPLPRGWLVEVELPTCCIPELFS